MNQIPTQPLSVRFGILTGAIIVLIAFSAQMFFSHQERTDLEHRLQEKSTFINSFYSYLIADALMRKDDVTLLQVVNRLEQDEEITSVIVVDQSDEVRYHADPQKMGTSLDDPIVKQVLHSGDAIMVSYQNSGGKALGIVSPLKIQGTAHAIGAVRIDLTFRRIDNQLLKPRHRFWFVVLGSLVSSIGFMLACVKRWVTGPLDQLRAAFAAVNAATPEPNLPESPDEVGQVYAAANELILRFKNEIQQQWSGQQTRAEQEKAWIQRLVVSFLPEARIIIADKDNRVISDTGNGASARSEKAPPAGRQVHLLDLIKDANFATLLTGAFQREGEVVRGPVMFQDHTYQASILSVPLQQSIAVKTLIALQPN